MVKLKLIEECLLQASSKDVVTQCCYLAVTSLGDPSPPQQGGYSALLGCDIQDEVKLHTSLCQLSSMILSQSQQDIREVFPDSFHPNLADLLTKIFTKNYDSWKNLVLDKQVSAATKIHGVEWEVIDEERRPSCVVKMKTNKEDSINIEMDHETLTTMVDSLVKIRQQISSVVS